MGALPIAELLLIAAGVLFLYYPLAGYLVEKWERLPEFSHGYMIPAISIYLVWRRKDSIAAAPRKPSAAGIWLAGVSLLLLLLANLGAVKTVACYSLITLIAGIVLALYGGQVLRLVLFPIAFLLFMIPVFTFIMTPVTFAMRVVAARMATSTIAAMGVSIYRDGALIYLPNGVIEVADACSGIRSLFALLALGAVYAYLYQGKTWERISLFLAGIPIAVAANYVRVTFLTLMSYRFGVDATLPSDSWLENGGPDWSAIIHDMSGFSVFVVAFMLLFGIGRVLEWRRHKNTAG